MKGEENSAMGREGLQCFKERVDENCCLNVIDILKNEVNIWGEETIV